MKALVVKLNTRIEEDATQKLYTVSKHVLEFEDILNGAKEEVCYLFLA